MEADVPLHVSRQARAGRARRAGLPSPRGSRGAARLQYFGLDAFTAAIDRPLDLAQLVCDRVAASEVLELMAPPSLGVVCFRRRFGGTDDDAEDGHNAGLVVALQQSGLGIISSTMLRGRYALRVCVLNHISFHSNGEPCAHG